MTGTNMREEKFSAFIDDELTGVEFDEMYSAYNAEEDLKQRWQYYHIISDTLQKHLPETLDCTLADRVMTALEKEPAILAPKHVSEPVSSFATTTNSTTTPITTGNKVSTRSKLYFKQIAGLAVAASVMVVAVFVSQTFFANDGAAPFAPVARIPSMPAENQFARITDPRLKATSGFQTSSVFQNRLNKYLANHNQYSTGVPGVMPYARIIGYTPNHNQQNAYSHADK